jgi:hypothetical protein
MNYPIKTKEYLHGGKVGESDLYEDLLEDGYPASMLQNLPRYLVYELELDVEIHENGDTVITHVAGQKLNTPITNA